MIKFFRNIRQRLIRESRFSKYLIYAIGEIILVVIGILIALQINNWNQLSQYESHINNHLNTVSENIRDDKIQLDSLSKFRQEAIISSKDLLHKYENNAITNSTEFINAFMYVAIEKRFARHTSGFDRLEEAELYQSKELTNLRELIAEYNKIIEEITFWEFRYNAFTEAMETELYSNGFFHATTYTWLNHEQLKPEYKNEIINDFQSLMNQHHSISSLFLRCVFTSQNVIDEYLQLIEKGTAINDEIENYLTKH